MRPLLLLMPILTSLLIQAQPPNNGFYLDASQSDFFKIPNTKSINETVINNRTYETYFYANETTSRQMIFMEGNDKREIIAYIEGGYLVVGAHNVDNDYLPLWAGTFFRKPISSNTWYHLALVFDNAQVPVNDPISVTDNTALKWYLDGVLQDEKAGFQIGGNGNHGELLVGYKNQKLWFPTCATWTSSGLSEYCFEQTINEDGGGENYFDGYIWGFRVWDTARTAAEIDEYKDSFIKMGEPNVLAALDGDTISYLHDNVAEYDVDNSNPSVLREWEGNVSVDWTDPLNWKNNLVPVNTKQERVFIQNNHIYYPEIGSTVIVGDLELEDDTTSITVLDGGVLDVSYDVINDGSLTVEDGGSLNIRESKPVTGTGSFSVRRASPNYAQSDLYSIWSTPVSEADSQLNTIFLHDIKTYKYDASQNPSAYVAVTGSESMEVGRGYFVRPVNTSGSIVMTFTGTLNNGNIDETIYYNSPTDNFNLIGNPYASSISWLDFHKDNSEVLDGTMYYWNHTVTAPNSASDYISFNQTGSNPPGASGKIAAGQGFFVMANQAGTVTFKNSHKVTESNTLFYGVNDTDNTITSNLKNQSGSSIADNLNQGRSWFRLSGNNKYSSMLIGFLEGATDGFDTAYDSELVDEGPKLKLYSFIEDTKYDIQGLPQLADNNDYALNLGIEVTSAGSYTISIDQEYIDTNFDIILDDMELGIQTDLRVFDYTFNLPSATVNNERFILRYNFRNTLGLEDQSIDENQLKVYFDNDLLLTLTKSDNKPSFMSMYDLNGNLILLQDFSKKVITKNLNPGLYIVTYTFKDSQKIVKKVLKN